MERFEGGEDINEFSNPQNPNQLDPKSTVFDASQYAFFGNDVVEEVELGGLEDDGDDGHLTGFAEEEYHQDGEEVEDLRSFTEADDLAYTFSNLNKVVSGPLNAGFTGDGPSRESSSVAEWVQDGDYPSWGHQPRFDGEGLQDSKRLPSHPYSSSHYMDSKDLYRTSSYPEQSQQYRPQHQQQQQQQQQQQLHPHYSSEPIIVPKSTFTSYPPPGGMPHQGSPNSQYQQSGVPYHVGGVRDMLPPPNRAPFTIPQRPLTSLQHGSNLGGNVPQLSPGLPVNSRLQNQLFSQTGGYQGDHSNLNSNLMRQNLPHNGLLTPQQQQLQHQRLHPQFQPPFSRSPGLNSQFLNQHLSTSPQMMSSFDMLGSGDMRDVRTRPLMKGGQSLRFSQGFEISSQRRDNGWPRFKSKYMTADEIENILRMQVAATLSNDPYTDDYYHQACLAKKSSSTKLRHHFCPNFLRDGSAAARANNEPHPFLQVDALGRVSFSSIRRPRPLLEVDPPNSSGNGCNEHKMFEKPLEQEPLLAARVIIEDGLCLLLDVDDIDRFLHFNQLQDNGVQLRKRRQELLEGLAASLQVVDPLVKNGSVDLAPEDDLVILRLLSLPKGRKLISKYLKLLSPGDELVRVICMAIYRHLRFLFGAIPADTDAAETSIDLPKVVSLSVNGLDLKALAACLASVVCSAEPPPLRPIGSPAGDGASVVVRSILERATELLRDPRANGNCSVPNRAFWQASFDAFFSLLTKYCFSKYDTVMQSIFMQSPQNASAVGPDVARAIGREMPVELLRASLPHTSEQQRKVLLEFAQRSMPVTQGFSGAGEQNNGS